MDTTETAVPTLLRPLYIFSLTALCVESKVLVGRELQRDDEVVESVRDTLAALTFAGAETWLVSDRPVTDRARTVDWLERFGVRASELYLGYQWGTEMGLDSDDERRLRAVFESGEYLDRWPGMTTYAVTRPRPVLTLVR